MNRKAFKHLLLDRLSSQIESLRRQILFLTEDALNDAKSSSGDKHETGLAMMHLEQEKLNAKLKEILEMQSVVLKLPEEKTVEKVVLGTIVKTDRALFYVSVAVPGIVYEGTSVICVSPSAPLIRAFWNQEKGSEIVFNNISYKILEIL